MRLFDASSTGPTPGLRKIARYTLINPGSDTTSIYLQIDINNPFIINETNSTRSGEFVNKAGISTGWTQGTITATCKDVEYSILPVLIPTDVMACQHEASYGHANGDSGSPVFTINGAGFADLRGIHWGYYPQITGFKIVFSPLEGIERDFGSLGGLPEITGTDPDGGDPDCDPLTAIIPC